ncbi:hypothetical protein [Helicobacter pylori]|uniref:hypothetical protein n=1 Tax=Helicobacter pylori TaxID=210 RepID=UPI000EACA40B|nr:hypothetical protein [Helicobacter pylori]
MKNRYHESHIIRSINKNGYTETDRMVEDYPKLKAENAELKQVNDLQKRLIESQSETIDALKRESDANQIIIKFLTEESYRDERKEHSKSCLGFE